MKAIFLIICLTLGLSEGYTQVSINNNGFAPNPSAMLDISSSSKGLLIPRLSSGSRIGILAPAKGLLVYDTTLSAFFYHNGTLWTQISSGATTNFWNINGNNIYKNNTGNVGIGTSSPAKPLDVAGAGGIQLSNGENASSNNEIFFSDNGQIRSLDNYHRIVFNRSSDQLEFYELGKILFNTGNPLTEVMRINSNGYVGIGTSLPMTPNNRLSVAGGITVDYNNQNNGTVANILSFGSSGDAGIGSYRPGVSPVNYHGLDFYTNSTRRVSIDIGGNVGIGTAVPAAKLDVEGSVKIADGSQGAGKVLTSDADGNAYWNGVVACSAGNCCTDAHIDSLQPNSSTTVVFKHEIYDDGGNNYDPTTGVFTAPVSGIYTCSAVLLMFWNGGSGSSDNIYFTIYKNDVYLTSSNTYYTGYPSSAGLAISMDVKLVAGDNIRFKINNFSNIRFIVFHSDGDTRMSIHLVK